MLEVSGSLSAISRDSAGDLGLISTVGSSAPIAPKSGDFRHWLLSFGGDLAFADFLSGAHQSRNVGL